MYGEEKDEVVQLYLDDIIPNRFQPREVFDERALKELAVSIKEHGVIQPIIVRNVNGKYEIVAGERRYKASALAGLTKIPAIIRNLDDKESSKVALLENLQRKNLNAIEEAKTYQKILELDQMTQEELAKTMGKSQSAVANKLRLLNLSEEVQDAILKEQISERHARALLNVPDSNAQKELLKKVIDEKISVRKLEEEINTLYPKEQKEPEEENEIQQATNGFLNNQPLTPTTVNIEEETNYGKVTVAPPQEGENKSQEKFLNYGEIGKEREETNEAPPTGFELPQTIEIDKIKENAKDINPPTDQPKSDIDGMLNITSGPITPAEKIVKETSSEEKNKPDDYFKTPDLAAIQVPPSFEQSASEPITNTIEINNNEDNMNQNIDIISTPVPGMEPEKYTVEIAKEKINNLVEDLKSHGIDINADEMNFPTSYQVIIKIQKVD